MKLGKTLLFILTASTALIVLTNNIQTVTTNTTSDSDWTDMEVFLFNFPIILVAIAFGAGLGAYVSYKKRIADLNSYAIQQGQVTARLIAGMGSELENGLEGLKTQTASLKTDTACIRPANQSTATATERLSALGERGKTMNQSGIDTNHIIPGNITSSRWTHLSHTVVVSNTLLACLLGLSFFSLNTFLEQVVGNSDFAAGITPTVDCFSTSCREILYGPKSDYDSEVDHNPTSWYLMHRGIFGESSMLNNFTTEWRLNSTGETVSTIKADIIQGNLNEYKLLFSQLNKESGEFMEIVGSTGETVSTIKADIIQGNLNEYKLLSMKI